MKGLFAPQLGLVFWMFVAACGGGGGSAGKDASADLGKDLPGLRDLVVRADGGLPDIATSPQPDTALPDGLSPLDSPGSETSLPDSASPTPDGLLPADAMLRDLGEDRFVAIPDAPGLDAPQVDAPSPDLPPDLAPDASPDADSPLFGTTWVTYSQTFMGAARVKTTLMVTATTFEQSVTYWTGSVWKPWMVLRGTLTPSTTGVYSATLAEIGMAQSGPLSFSAAGSESFNGLREHVWGAANTLPLRLLVVGGQLQYQRDCDGDGDFDGAYDRSLGWFTRYLDGIDDAPHQDASGTYPHLQYVGLNFHGQSSSVTTHIQVGQNFGGTPTSVTVDLIGYGGQRFSNLATTYDPDRKEWGLDPFVFPATPTSGIWWVVAVAIQMDNGSHASYTAMSPIGGYSGTFTTDTGSTGLIPSLPTLVGQDYLPPPTGTFYYIDTFPNASTTSARVDPGLKIYAENDLANWIARNDDRVDLWAGLKVPLISGKKYFICAEDFYGNGNAYSIRVSNTGFGGTSQGTAAIPDAAEPDDGPASAKEIRLGQVLDRSFKRYDTDWFYFVAP